MANTIYCSSDTQAMLDLYAGILHAEEGDYRTAHSFFYEAVEAKPENPAIAGRALTYMLLMLLILEKVSLVFYARQMRSRKLSPTRRGGKHTLQLRKLCRNLSLRWAKSQKQF